MSALKTTKLDLISDAELKNCSLEEVNDFLAGLEGRTFEQLSPGEQRFFTIINDRYLDWLRKHGVKPQARH